MKYLTTYDCGIIYLKINNFDSVSKLREKVCFKSEYIYSMFLIWKSRNLLVFEFFARY